MHFCKATIRVSGDVRTVIVRDTHNPVSWPELEILRALHGDESISDVKPFIRVEQSSKDEKERLRQIYGNAVAEGVFPGRNPQMEMDAPGAKLPTEKISWRNPIDKDPVKADEPAEIKKPQTAAA
jgi:hypothetical protein